MSRRRRRTISSGREKKWPVVLFVGAIVGAWLLLLVPLSRGHRPVAQVRSSLLRPAEGFEVLPEPAFGPPEKGVLAANDITELPSGWAILDNESNQIALLDQSGGVVRRFGREGDGPGELRRPGGLAFADSMLVVMDLSGREMDVFRVDGRFQGRVQVAARGCRGTSLRRLSAAGRGLAILRTCNRGDGRTAAIAEWLALDGTRELIVDSVYADLRAGRFEAFVQPVMAVIGDRVYFAITPDPCVSVYVRGKGREGRVCHPDTNPLVFTDSIRAAAARAASRLEDSRVSVVIPDRYPPYDRLFQVDGNLAFHVGLSDTTEAVEIARGGALERIVLPPRMTGGFGGRSVLITKQLPEGIAFAVVPLP